MVALIEHRDVGDSLIRLARALESLELVSGTILAAERDRLAGTIRSYLIPRVIDPSVPMTVVLAGPTGSGKSTLVNSLAGLDASPTGALRPTTTVPIVLTAPGRHHHYQAIGGVPCEVVSVEAPILESVVLVDAPDIDSTSTGHRAEAETLIDNADIVVFVTSSLRYADDVPWQVLRRAVSRGAPVVNVLNRVGSATAGAIVDFKARLGRAGLDENLITVPEHHLADAARRVPDLAVQSLRQRLTALMASRDDFAGAVVERVTRSTVAQVAELTRSFAATEDGVDQLESELSVTLANHVTALSLSGVGEDLYSPPPASPSRRAVRRWRKEGRREHARPDGFESKVADRIAAVVYSDIRQWLVEERPHLRLRGVEGPGVDSVTSAARSASEEWTRFVARIADEHVPDDIGLGGAVLIHAATTDAMVPAVEILFGAAGPDVVARARRELIGRIVALYSSTGRLVAGALASGQGNVDDAELRASLGAVRSALSPVHA